MTEPSPLLSGVRVLDVTKATSGPFGTQILADLGADVVKVEEPPRGAHARDVLDARNRIDDMDAYFACVNRSKRGLALTLADPAGLDVFYRLVAQADVVVDNHRPGVTTKLKIDHERLAAASPRIITASLSGYGASGPLAARAGFDITVQAQTGMTMFTGLRDEQGRPKASDAAIADLLGGMYLAVAVPAAIVRRDRTGVGCHIDLGMYDSVLTWFAGFGVHLLNFGQESDIADNVLWGSFETADRPLVITAHRTSQYERFCRALEQSEWLTDPRFATATARADNLEELKLLIDGVLKTRTAEEWIERFEAAGVSYGETLTVPEALGHEHTRAREMVVDVTSPRGETMTLIGNPIKVDGVAQRYASPPQPGEHTAGVLADWLGLDDTEIAALQQAGAVYALASNNAELRGPDRG
jgi:CoA:oxalate CoA-transferase